MYKKIALLFAVLCISKQCASNATSWSGFRNFCHSLSDVGSLDKVALEIKPSYFLFSASPMRHIYNHGGFEVQGSASVPFCNYLDFYGSIGVRKAWGRALNTCEKTSLTVVPIDIGLKSICNFCDRYYYFFAIGPRCFYVHQHNKSPYVDCTLNGGGIGLFLNTGINVQLADCFLLGVFGEYSYEKKAFCPKRPNVFTNGSVQIGGFAFGVSLGYAF